MTGVWILAASWPLGCLLNRLMRTFHNDQRDNRDREAALHAMRNWTAR